MRKRGFLVVLSVLLALMLVVASCGPAEEPDDPDDPDEPSEPVAEFDYNATVIISRGEEAETLDIQNSTHAATNSTWEIIGDGLVILDWDGNVSPLIAEDWDVCEEGLTYTFYIRDDVKFHSGKALTAHDVEATFKRWVSLETSPTRHDLGIVEEVRATDDYTFVLRLEEPNNAIWNVLISPYASILNLDNVEAEGDDWGTPRGTIDSTGPFILQSWARGDRMELVRNEEYAWGPAAVYENTGPVQFEKLIIRVIPEGTTRAAELVAGNIDFDTGVPLAEVPQVEEADNLITVYNRPPSLSFLGIHTEKSPMDDTRVRKALSYAMNRQEISDVSREGMGEPAFCFLRPGTLGYDERIMDHAHGYDIDTAIGLLEEAGWTEVGSDGIRVKDGEPLKTTLSISDDEAAIVQGELIQAYARSIGMDIELKLYEIAALFEHLRAAEHDMFTMGVGYARRGPDTLFWYHHPSQRPAPNRFYYDNDELTRLLELSRITPDENEMLGAYFEIEKILLEEVPWIYLVFRDHLSAYNERIVDPKIEHPMYTYMKLLDLQKKTD